MNQEVRHNKLHGKRKEVHKKKCCHSAATSTSLHGVSCVARERAEKNFLSFPSPPSKHFDSRSITSSKKTAGTLAEVQEGASLFSGFQSAMCLVVQLASLADLCLQSRKGGYAQRLCHPERVGGNDIQVVPAQHSLHRSSALFKRGFLFLSYGALMKCWPIGGRLVGPERAHCVSGLSRTGFGPR